MLEIIRDEIDSPDFWVGTDIQNDARWLYQLDQLEIAELDPALQAVKAAGRLARAMTR